MISSCSNKLISLVKSLSKTKVRNETGLFLLEGDKFIKDAIDHKVPYRHILIDENKIDEALTAKQSQVIEHKLFCSLCTTSTPQSMIGVFEKPEYSINDIATINNILFLNNVQDASNVGALIRSSDCAGFDFVLLDEGCADPYSPKAIRSSAGSVLNVAVARDKNSPRMIEKLKEQGFMLIATSLDAVEDLNFSKNKNILMLGSEGKGLDAFYENIATKNVKIPMQGAAQSLNVAAAGVVLMYKISGLL